MIYAHTLDRHCDS